MQYIHFEVLMKYSPLTEHLKRVDALWYPMTFSQIEGIIGGRLPESARRHRAWWSNNPDNSSMTTAWLAAGWYSSDVDMGSGKLVFRRREDRREQSVPNSPNASRAPQFSFSGLPEQVMDILKIKAEIRNVTVEQYAASVLVADAQLSMQERLQLADAIRTQGPKLTVNVPGMIREDRDRS
jgi:hypothetical protein